MSVFFLMIHSAVSLPRPVDDITLLDDIINQRRALRASIRHFLWRRGAAVCFTLQRWISTCHLMPHAALTPAAHMERPYWKIHMSQLRRNTRAASRTRDEPRDESECVSSLIFQLMSPDEGKKRWCRSAGEDVCLPRVQTVRQDVLTGCKQTGGGFY